MRLGLITCLGVAACTTDGADRADATPDTSAPSCVTAADCDDRKPCTIDRCEEGHCTWSVAPGACFANNVCAAAGEPRPGEPCEICDPTQTADGWTPVPDDTACDDGDACTTSDACAAGVCGGSPLACDDGNACTRERCERALGCVTDRLNGPTCDDGDRCTGDDRCADGLCSGAPRSCDDGDPCTVDACDQVGGCRNTPSEGLACEDGDRCTTTESCSAGACVPAAKVSCDDGNLCTLDTCDSDVGCVHLPTLSPCCIGVDSVCDDGDPCTDDACDPLSGACSYGANRAACDDQDPCTVDDFCVDMACTGGAPRSCDDGNPCTEDRCEASFPGLCLHTALTTGACDDGLACSSGDTCVSGKCQGDTSDCVCVPDLRVDGVKLTALAIGTSGQPGDGLDVDEKPATCAPEGSCSAGVDNTLSVIAAFANDPLSSAVGAGQVMLVVELGPLATNPVEVAVYDARLAPTNTTCAFQTQTCDYLVARSFLDATTCEPIAKIAATLTGDTLRGGGPGTTLPFSIPFDADTALPVELANLRIEATITRDNGEATGLTGILGGAVPKQTLLDGIANLPDGTIPGVTTASVLQLVELLVQNDIDTDGDGTPDAASIGVKITGIDARLVGVAE